MSQDFFRSSRAASVGSGYRFFRGLVRLWIALAYGRLRMLAAEDLPPSSPVVLVVSHPGGFLESLFLIAATDRQVRCLVDRAQTRGPLRKFLCRRLGMIPFDAGDEGWRRAAETAMNVLGNLGAVALFTEFQPADRRQPERFASYAAGFVLEAESRNANQLDVTVMPVHLVLSRLHSRPGELLAFFDRRIKSHVYMLPGKSLEERRPALSSALDQACRENVFRLQPQDVQHFLTDVEEVLLTDLREDFAKRRNWKQKVEEFHLSGFVGEWVEQLNRLDPGRLAGLRESLNAFREAQRRASLEKLEVEGAGPWLDSPWRRALGWLETTAGFPVALYGFLNHLPAIAILKVAGLMKKQAGTNRTALWISRAVIVLGFYALQIIFCDRFLGRVAAGYYALSLPISALYFWRYLSLLRRTTRFLYLRSRVLGRANLAREKRRALVRELNDARDLYVAALDRVP
jgi:1-acyl-sn-glycerol-3-phosphate acyltransferase